MQTDKTLTCKFPKSEKLCSQKAIQDVFKTGNKLYKYPFRLYFKEKNQENSKVLISVPKKMQKLAVNRNLLKRHAREAIRLNKNNILKDQNETYDLGFVYLSKDIVDSKQIHKSIEVLLNKMMEVKDEK